MMSPTRSPGRIAVLVVAAVALIAATAFLVPGPAQLVVALLSLPLGAYLFANVGQPTGRPAPARRAPRESLDRR